MAELDRSSGGGARGKCHVSAQPTLAFVVWLTGLSVFHPVLSEINLPYQKKTPGDLHQSGLNRATVGRIVPEATFIYSNRENILQV